MLYGRQSSCVGLHLTRCSTAMQVGLHSGSYFSRPYSHLSSHGGPDEEHSAHGGALACRLQLTSCYRSPSSGGRARHSEPAFCCRQAARPEMEALNAWIKEEQAVSAGHKFACMPHVCLVTVKQRGTGCTVSLCGLLAWPHDNQMMHRSLCKLLNHHSVTVQRGNAEVAQKEYMERLSQVWAKHNSHPLKSLASLMVQAPVFICFFSALRHMAAAQARY